MAPRKINYVEQIFFLIDLNILSLRHQQQIHCFHSNLNQPEEKKNKIKVKITKTKYFFQQILTCIAYD
jgi:hypothetical protein